MVEHLANAEEARLRYYQDRIEAIEPDELKKPKIFCDGAYLTLQDGRNLAVDAKGYRIKKPDGSYYTLAEWEALHGRNAGKRSRFLAVKER